MLTDAFVSQVERRPRAFALGFDGIAIDYLTLFQQASAIARLLGALCVGQGDRVALALPKNNGAVAAMFGILLAGAAYVPLDRRLPPQRLARTLVNCDAKVLVTTASTIERIYSIDAALVRSFRAVVTNASCSLENALAHDFEQRADAFTCSLPLTENDAAYILYTSGSTGEPKGVVHTHRSATKFVNWATRTFDLGPSQRLTSNAQLSFDLSVFDIFGALSSGASVEIIRSELMLRPKELVKKLNQWQISLLYAVPLTIALLESDGDISNQPLLHLNRVLYAGEAFSVPRLRRVMQALPRARFYNLYGPTETNVCTYYPVPILLAEDTLQIPIGQPCDHLTVELRDEQARETPQGEQGEVCVAGPCVMAEYFRRPDATRNAFFNASSFADGLARYRTGDRATVDGNGCFWFNGRRDRLVKRRGYRIELGEIEAAIDHHPLVRETAAFTLSEGDEIQIRAAVVLYDGQQVTPLTLKAHCGRLLPPYVVPDSISIISQMPRTATGKVDLKRLREQTAV